MVEELSVRLQAPPLFLGDQVDTHAIVHTEVTLVWWHFLERMREKFPADSPNWKQLPGRTIMLRGNHDAPVNFQSGATSLLAHVSQCRVVLEPTVEAGVLFMPYFREPERFVEACRLRGECLTVVCHQAFDGSKFETGYFAEGEAKPSDVPQEKIVSGHVHSPQEFGKVWHPGAPRWRVEVDAKVDLRAIWLVEFDAAGRLVNREPFPTNDAVRQIMRFVDLPSTPAPTGPWAAKDEVRVDVRGPREYVEARAPLHEAAGALVRRLPDPIKRPQVKESDGVMAEWSRWVGGYKAPRGTAPARLKSMLKERLGEEKAAA